MKGIIDRIEGEYAVLEWEDGQMVNLPRLLVPTAKEGDVVDISIDQEETKARKKRVQKLMDNLFQED